MGVYIPNMEKPKDCEVCPFLVLDGAITDDNEWVSYSVCDLLSKTIGDADMLNDCPLIEIDDELIQEELTKMAWCEGFSDGFTKAQETISNYIKRMGFAVEIPKVHELYVRLKGEKDE